MTHILVVDDSPTDVHTLKTVLEKNSYKVTVASSGEQGVELAKSAKPDVVLMDVVMPGLNGFQATRQLTKDPATSAIPVIIVSSKGQETDKVWGTRQGAKGYIVKPINEKELLSSIEATLAARV